MYNLYIGFMSFVYLKNKKSGVTYVYECLSYWNKEKKQSDSKRTCIGKLDKVTGEIIPSKRIEAAKLVAIDEGTKIATIKKFGASILLDHINKETDLELILKEVFPLISLPR